MQRCDSEREKKSVFNWSFFSSVLFSPLHFLFKDTRRRENKRKEKEQRYATTQPRARRRLQKNSGRKGSLSPPLKNYFHLLFARRERERKRERESAKKKARRTLVVLRETFFSFARKKKAHLSSHLISSHLCWKDYASRAAKRRKKRRRRRWWRRW